MKQTMGLIKITEIESVKKEQLQVRREKWIDRIEEI